MTGKEKAAYVKWARSLTDDELEKEYYNAAYNCLGSVAEEMYERGFDIIDIREQERHERDLGIMSGILEGVCVERGIPLWGEYGDG